jgi:hypothetical protein
MMTPEEQGARNIALLGRQLLHFLDHPEDLALVDGKEVVLLPNNDHELEIENEALVERLHAQDAGVEPPVSGHLVPS